MDKTVKTILKIGGIFAATQIYEVLVKGHMLYLVEPLLDENVDFKSGADLICEPTKKLRYKSIMAVKDFSRNMINKVLTPGKLGVLLFAKITGALMERRYT